MSGPPDDSRINVAEKEGWSESWSNYDDDHTWQVLDELFAVADQVGRSPAQVALNWLLNCPHVTCPIIGARTMEHFNDNVSAISWSLDEEQMRRLNAASELTAPRYPYGFINRFKRVLDDQCH